MNIVTVLVVYLVTLLMKSILQGDFVKVQHIPRTQDEDLFDKGVALDSSNTSDVTLYTSRGAIKSYKRDICEFSVGENVLTDLIEKFEHDVESVLGSDIAEELSRKSSGDMVREFLRLLSETRDVTEASGKAVHHYIPDSLAEHTGEIADILLRTQEGFDNRL